MTPKTTDGPDLNPPSRWSIPFHSFPLPAEPGPSVGDLSCNYSVPKPARAHVCARRRRIASHRSVRRPTAHPPHREGEARDNPGPTSGWSHSLSVLSPALSRLLEAGSRNVSRLVWSMFCVVTGTRHLSYFACLSRPESNAYKFKPQEFSIPDECTFHLPNLSHRPPPPIKFTATIMRLILIKPRILSYQPELVRGDANL